MTVQAWDPPPDGAVETYSGPSVLPRAAAALVEWASAAEAAHQLAVQLCQTGFVPKEYFGEPALGTAAILAGSELGLSPIQALLSFDVIDGRPAPRALTLRALLERHGHQFLITTSTAKVAKGRARRRGTSEWQEAEYTWEMAARRGLTGKRNWVKQPEDMLIARLTGRLARLVAADAILGIPYTAEELEDQQDAATVSVVRPGRTRVQRTKGPAGEGAPVRPEPDADLPDPGVGSPPPDRPDTTAAAADEPDPAAEGFAAPSPAATRMMWALIGQRFGDSHDPDVRDRVLEHISLLLDRAVDTTRGLSADEVSTVITDLSPDGPDEPGADDA